MTAGPQNRAWKRFATWAVSSSVALVLAFVGGMSLIDPYDTGRSPFSREPDLRGQRELNATASVGRNPKYEAAVIGNSTISQITPSRVTALTGIPFAQLAVPGAQIPEQIAVLDWFMKHHDGTAKALVMALSREIWCASDPTQPGNNSFPFWRISDSTSEYLAGLISMSSAKQAARRLGIIPASRAKSGPDGFWDYEPLYAALFADAPQRRELLFKRQNDRNALGEPSFPGVRVLGEKLAALPADLPVVLVVPPVFTARQPQSGTPRHRAEQACRQRLIDLAARRPNTALVEWWDDRPEFRKTDAFIDQIHYRHPIARTMEQDIAAALLDIRKRAGSLTLR
ncbi:hypothetical protein [Microvirga calopogonii]|uniref:hypothetical protein n=1 Tax=Microvirga calopogonii TaxID=2078013 RepID=UPI000E0DA48D|nr:hypothetical protein [Microvirga calopogonii]